ncbi:MAG: HAD-IA family hydrolase [Thermoanaerobaculia bacterium]
MTAPRKPARDRRATQQPPPEGPTEAFPVPREQLGSGPIPLARRRVRAVTFDVTGTLIHTPRRAEIYGEVLRRHGFSVDTEAVRWAVEEAWREFDCQGRLGHERFGPEIDDARRYWRRFLARLCALLDLPAPSRFAARELFDAFARPDAWEVYRDAPPTLAALRGRGLALGVVSNWDHRLPGLLEAFGPEFRFQAIVYSQRAGVEKPEPAIFRRALRELVVEPDEAVHVGDRPTEDVEGARAAGMHALLLDRTGAGDLAHLGELLPWLDENN